MKEIDVHQVDAFAEEIFGGNPAGVVTDANILTEIEMQNIAREMNLSETAFVLAPSAGNADLKLRYFTPTQEVPFCGHATVGALFQLAILHAFELDKPGENTVNIETGAGVLTAGVINHEETTKVTFDAPTVALTPYRLQGAAFAEAFGIPAELIKSDATILKDKDLNFVYVPTASLQMLGEQSFDFSRIREQFGTEEIVVFGLFSNGTMSESADLHARGLAPNIGIDEDPFTGAMQAGLVYAAKQNGFVEANKEIVVTEQGHFIGRPGRAEVHHNVASNEFRIAARAVRVFSSRWKLA